MAPFTVPQAKPEDHLNFSPFIFTFNLQGNFGELVFMHGAYLATSALSTQTTLPVVPNNTVTKAF